MPFDVLPVLNFPAEPLDERVELLLNDTWTDVSKYVERDPNTVQRGHPDESTTTAPTVLGLTFQNGDGRFTEGNPLSPYYPYLRRNTRCRVSLPEGASYLRLEGDTTSYAQGPASLNIAGDLEIQLDVTLDNWNASQFLASKYASGGQRSWQLVMLDDSATLTLIVSPDGAASTILTATAPVPLPPLLRQCLRVTYQASTGTATFYTAAPGLTGASWTQAGAAVSAGTAVVPFSSATPVLLGYGGASTVANGINGKVHAFLLLSGIGGTTQADPDFTVQVPGVTSFTDGQGNTWTLNGTAEISSRKYRAHVEIPQWAQSQDPSGQSVYCKVQGGGTLRRLGMGQTPALSPMTRASLMSPVPLAACWPAEDGSNAVTVASALGGTPMVAAGNGVPSFASNSSFACSQPIPVMNGGTFYGTVTTPAGFTWTDNLVRFLAEVPSGDDTNGAVMAQFTTTGTCALVQLVYGTGGNLTLNVYRASGSLIGSQSLGAGSIGLGIPSIIEIGIVAATGFVSAVVQAVSQGTAAGPAVAFTGSVGAVRSVAFGGGLTGTALGQFAVAPASSDSVLVAGTISALTAWNGETAATRFARLCSEEGIACRIRGQASATPAMGAQTVQTIPQLLQECADADLGMWTELRQALGFGYRCRSSIGNQGAAVTVSFDADHMDVWSSDPVADDQIIVNDVTVSQSSGGSSARAVADTGQPQPGGSMAVSVIGRYDQSYPVNVQAARLADNAGWRLRMGTVAEPRYPGIAIDLANAALYQQGLILPLLDMDLGDRLTMQFPPGFLPPGAGDQIDQVMNGVLETMWQARILGQQWQGIPYSPWPVGVTSDSVYGFADTDGSTLHANAAFGAGTIAVDTTGTSPLWTANGADYPLLLTCQGMVIKVSACSGTTSPQTFTVTQWGVNGVQKNLTAGSPVSLAYQAVAGM